MTRLTITDRAAQRALAWFIRKYTKPEQLYLAKMSTGRTLTERFCTNNGISEFAFEERTAYLINEFVNDSGANLAESLITGLSPIFLYALENGDIHYRTNTRTQEHLLTHNPRPRDGEVVRRLEDLFATTRNTGRGEHQGGTHASPVRHSVREHLRQLKDGRIVYVRPHTRGSREPANRITIV